MTELIESAEEQCCPLCVGQLEAAVAALSEPLD